MTRQAKPDEKIVFGLAPTQTGESYVATLAVTDKAWDFMKDGLTHTLDLRQFGVPLQIIMFGTRTQADARKVLEEHNRKAGVATKHMPDDQDFGIREGSSRLNVKNLKGSSSLS